MVALELKKILDPAMFIFSFGLLVLSLCLRRFFCVAVQLRVKIIRKNIG